MMDSFESILDESISALQAGVPIEEVLAEVPDYAPEMRSLLYAAAILTDPDPVPAPEEKKSALRDEYMKQLAELPAIPSLTFSKKVQATLRIVRRRLTGAAILNDLITVTITIALSLLVMVLVLNYLAIDTIPGDFLYGVKRISENAQLSFAFNEGRRNDLEEKFNQRRLTEFEQLIEQNRVAVIQFRGLVETKGENLWIVENHPIFLPNDLTIEEDIQEGDIVEVIGLLRANNVLVADTIKLVK